MHGMQCAICLGPAGPTISSVPTYASCLSVVQVLLPLPQYPRHHRPQHTLRAHIIAPAGSVLSGWAMHMSAHSTLIICMHLHNQLSWPLSGS